MSSISSKLVFSSQHSSPSAAAKCRNRLPQFLSSPTPTPSKTPNKYNNPVFFHQELSNCSIAHSDLHLSEILERQSRRQSHDLSTADSWQLTDSHPGFLTEAYERSRGICAAYSKSYYLASLLFTEERRKAIWAIYVWCRSTDELVDGPNAFYMSADVLDRWEEKLHDIFNGRPYDMLDAALTDTVTKFSMDIKPFKDLIQGMRMDTSKCRYDNFQELYQYCYYVAGTIGLMTIPVMGIPPESLTSARKIYNGALYLGIANQLTNILRDVGEDTLYGRVYLPQDELAEFGLSDKDIYSRKVSDRWREFIKFQIERARFYYSIAEKETSHLNTTNHWPIFATTMLYQKILDVIEDNDYDNLTKKAFVGRTNKLLMLPLAYSKTIFRS